MNTDNDLIYSELLFIRYLRGDKTALEELARYWEKRLFYYISRLVDNEEDAWDALQDTWVAFIRNTSKLREPRKLVMWLYKTARHKAMDKLRERYDNRTVPMECEDIPAAEECSETFEDAQQVHKALGEISVHHREVLTLFFMEDLLIDEIAEVLDTPVGTVKSRLHFARKALRAVIEKEEAI